MVQQIGGNSGRWDTGSIPSQAQWVRDPDLAWPQLHHRSQRRLGSDPWPGNSQKKKKIPQHKIDRESHLEGPAVPRLPSRGPTGKEVRLVGDIGGGLVG